MQISDRLGDLVAESTGCTFVESRSLAVAKHTKANDGVLSLYSDYGEAKVVDNWSGDWGQHRILGRHSRQVRKSSTVAVTNRMVGMWSRNAMVNSR